MGRELASEAFQSVRDGGAPPPQRGRPLANPVAVLREDFEDCAVLFDPDTAEVAGLNETGVAIWKLLDGSRTVRQVVEDVQQSFEEAPPEAAASVAAFIESLVQRGFVDYIEGGRTSEAESA